MGWTYYNGNLSTPEVVCNMNVATETEHYNRCINWINDRAREVSRQWFNEQLQDPFTRYYVYFTRGSVVAAPEQPGPDYWLLFEDCLDGNTTKEQARLKILDALRRSPCLPYDL